MRLCRVVHYIGLRLLILLSSFWPVIFLRDRLFNQSVPRLDLTLLFTEGYQVLRDIDEDSVLLAFIIQSGFCCCMEPLLHGSSIIEQYLVLQAPVFLAHIKEREYA